MNGYREYNAEGNESEGNGYKYMITNLHDINCSIQRLYK